MLNKSSKKYARGLKFIPEQTDSNELYKNQSIKSQTSFSMPIDLKLNRNKNAQEICPFKGVKPRTFCTILSCVSKIFFLIFVCYESWFRLSKMP